MAVATIVVHGGAWSIPRHVSEAYKLGVQRAAREGYQVLVDSCSAIDAVEKAVRVLEDDPTFNAGTGSVLNSEGDIEMDAIIMEGKDLRTGAVACVQNIQNPVSLARMVMEKTKHTLLVGQGANCFAEQSGMKQVPKEQLVCAESIKKHEMFRKYETAVHELFKAGKCHDTVGAVAVDSSGNVACATSTGGITGKQVGRVGDSPLIGCGAYSDNNVGSVSVTGHGEAISRVTLSRRILTHMEQGLGPQEAAETALSYMTQRVQGSGGAIVVSKTGDIGIAFSTEGMGWASLQNGQLCYGLQPGERKTIDQSSLTE